MDVWNEYCVLTNTSCLNWSPLQPNLCEICCSCVHYITFPICIITQCVNEQTRFIKTNHVYKAHSSGLRFSFWWTFFLFKWWNWVTVALCSLVITVTFALHPFFLFLTLLFVFFVGPDPDIRHRRGRHARGDHSAKQLFRLGPVRWRLPAQ